MRRFACACAVSVGLALFAGLCPRVAHGDIYTYTNIADTGFSFSDFQSQTSINNSGQVAFTGAAKGTPLEGIFVGDGSADAQLRADTSITGDFSGLSAPSINRDGTVVYQAALRTGATGIFTTASDLTRSTIVQSDSTFASFGAFPQINTAGHVAFYAILKTGVRAIYTGDGALLAQVLSSGGLYSDFNTTPSINDADFVTFVGFKSGGNQSLVFALPFNPTTVAQTDSSIKSFGLGPWANAQSQVAFLAHSQATPSKDAIAIKDLTTGALTPVVSTAVDPYAGLSDPTINVAGNVAFFAATSSGKFGVFTGADPATSTVVVVGQALFGSTVTQVRYTSGLNDNGEIPFYYTLANGRIGIAVASPNTLVRPIISGASYGDVRLHDGLGSGLLARMRDGNAAADRTLNMAFVPHRGDFGIRAGTHLVGDTMTLSGTGSDLFVLEFTYTDSDLLAAGVTDESKLVLEWLDPSDNTVKNAVFGNTPVLGIDNTGLSFDAYSASVSGTLQLGAFGNDPASNTVWAVLNHNSTFVLTDGLTVPEPRFLLAVAAPLIFLRRPPRPSMRTRALSRRNLRSGFLRGSGSTFYQRLNRPNMALEARWHILRELGQRPQMVV